MSASGYALLGFVMWQVLLLLGIGAMRVGLVLGGRRRANDFKPDGADVSAFSNRLCRAHANCYENLAAVAAVILLAMLLGRGGVTDPLAPVLLAARVAQSVTHLVSTSQLAVQLRFAFFAVQTGIVVYWIARLALA